MDVGRLIGAKPPLIPAGGRAFVAMSADQPARWTIRYAIEGEEPTTDRPRVLGTPTFSRQVVAYAFLDWVTGAAPTFTYPAGEA